MSWDWLEGRWQGRFLETPMESDEEWAKDMQRVLEKWAKERQKRAAETQTGGPDNGTDV